MFEQHLTADDMPLFTKLRMTAFGEAVVDIANDPQFDEWTFSQKIRHALGREIAARDERRFLKLLKASGTPNMAACVEDIHYLEGRTLNREVVARLAACKWVDNTTNLVILGASSVGKSYLAQALVNAACRRDYSAKYYRLDDLANQLAVYDRSDAARLKFLDGLHTCDVLVLDDFLTTPISSETAAELLNILASREGRGSTVVTSQFDPEDWYKSLHDAVIAESILNRIVSNAEIVQLDGPNMRTHATVIREAGDVA
ncbi:DNA replication protein DnaC [Leucobacter exalbidus]|uniref:DNA replication protein DnaC n=1 Tax=Leucobacter exalbidus TaxID=662960 RepID=A0A940PTQ1_9MICO|nr:ATP-binding protein [Leucobacter exalbidus]MBP1325041.1 DNA replication protein DnaC [Leucobacter exalbidus]